MSNDTAEVVEATEVQETPLEKSLRAQWYGEEGKKDALPWQERKARIVERIMAATPHDEPPSEIDEWIAEMPAEWMVRYLVAVRAMGNTGLAARRCQVSPYLVQKHAGEHPCFAAAIVRAREAFVDSVEGAVAISATVGDVKPIFQGGVLVGHERRKSEKAAELYLSAKRKSEWGKTDTGVTINQVALPSGDAVVAALRSMSQMQIQDTPEAESAGTGQSGTVQ